MKMYVQPQSTSFQLRMERVVASSPGLKDELGDDDQLSNNRSGWDIPEWADED